MHMPALLKRKTGSGKRTNARAMIDAEPDSPRNTRAVPAALNDAAIWQPRERACVKSGMRPILAETPFQRQRRFDFVAPKDRWLRKHQADTASFQPKMQCRRRRRHQGAGCARDKERGRLAAAPQTIGKPRFAVFAPSKPLARLDERRENQSQPALTPPKAAWPDAARATCSSLPP